MFNWYKTQCYDSSDTHEKWTIGEGLDLGKLNKMITDFARRTETHIFIIKCSVDGLSLYKPTEMLEDVLMALADAEDRRSEEE